jgi:hypothetical protein
LTDTVELRALAAARASDEAAAEAAEAMQNSSAIAAAVQDLDADTPPKAETRTGRFLAELQSNRQLTDDQMARLLDVDLETFLEAKAYTTKLRKLSTGRIFDAWAYDAIRDALLKVAPDRLAEAIRQWDIERGKRLLDRLPPSGRGVALAAGLLRVVRCNPICYLAHHPDCQRSP